MNIEKVGQRVQKELERRDRRKQVLLSMQSSIPEPISSIGTKYIAGAGNAERRTTVETSYKVQDAFVGGVINKLSADICDIVVSDLSADNRFAVVINTINDSLEGWVKRLLIEGDLFVHILMDEEEEGRDGSALNCGVSVDHQSYNYQRESDRFDSSPTFSYYQDGRLIPITEPIVHARIMKSGRYGRPLFYDGFRTILTLGRAEEHEAKRRFLSSVQTNYHKFDQFATAQQMSEYLKSISPADLDDVFRHVATQQEVTTVQGDGNVDKIQFLTYLLGRIDPLSPVPLPLLSYEAAAQVNRDTLTQMMRDYRSNLSRWRETVLDEIVRPILRVVADAEGVDVDDEILATTISGKASLSPAEVMQIITTATQMRVSGLVPADYVADYIGHELGIAPEDVMGAMIDSADIIGEMA